MTWIDTVQADIGLLHLHAHHTLGTRPDWTHGLLDPNNPRDKAAQALRAAATRGADRDQDYATIPDTHVRTSEQPDPTQRQALAGLRHDDRTCRQLHQLTDTWYAAVAQSLHVFGRDVTGPAGTPAEPPTPQIDTHGRLSVPAPDQPHWVTETCAWLWWASQALWDAPESEQHHIRLRNLQHVTRRTLKRIKTRRDNTPAPNRPCTNPHGLTRHPAGPDQQNGVCRRCRTQPYCADPLDRGCGRQLSRHDNRTTCGPCRVAKHRQKTSQ